MHDFVVMTRDDVAAIAHKPEELVIAHDGAGHAVARWEDLTGIHVLVEMAIAGAEGKLAGIDAPDHAADIFSLIVVPYSVVTHAWY